MSYFQQLGSKGKVRYEDGTYNLDLCYIRGRIIAMGFPATGVESIYRNPQEEVRKFLDENHPGFYKIYNLSGVIYSSSLFNGPVENYSFPDHHPPPFQILLEIILSISDWLSQNQSNVVCVHCMAGVGRTGCVICSLLLYLNENQTPDSAIEHFLSVRISPKKNHHVNPCQRRYVNYFYEFLTKFGKNFSSYDAPEKEILKFSINKQILDSHICICDPLEDVMFNTGWIPNSFNVKQKKTTWTAGFKVKGDMLIKLFVMKGFINKSMNMMFRLSLNTLFLHGSEILVSKKLLDGAKDLPDDIVFRILFARNSNEPEEERLLV